MWPKRRRHCNTSSKRLTKDANYGGLTQHQVARVYLHRAPAADDSDHSAMRQDGQVVAKVDIGKHLNDDIDTLPARGFLDLSRSGRRYAWTRKAHNIGTCSPSMASYLAHVALRPMIKSMVGTLLAHELETFI